LKTFERLQHVEAGAISGRILAALIDPRGINMTEEF
jgi:hypothetical protein